MGTRSRLHRFLATPSASNNPAGQSRLDEWVKTAVQIDGLGKGEVKELEAYNKVLAKRKLQQQQQQQADEEGGRLLSIASNFVSTKLTQETKGRPARRAMLTAAQDDRDDESIFEFENDSCECGVVYQVISRLLQQQQ